MISAYGDGAVGGLAGPEAKRAVRLARPKARKNDFWIKNWIFEFTKALKICRRRLRGILTWGFFLNSSMLLKDFRKI
jgi:hypothetical protein